MEMAITQDMTYKVTNDIQADEMVSEIKEFEAEINRFDMIYNARITALNQDYVRQVESLKKQIQFNKDMLQAYFLTVPAKATKIQRTYKLLSGKLVMKNESISITKDNEEKLIDWVRTYAPQYIKVKEEVNWSEFKKVLKIAGDSVVNQDGEIIEGAAVKVKGEEFSISL